MILIYHVTSSDHVFKWVVLIYGWKLLIISHRLARFDGHRSCGSRGKTDLTFHVTLQDHLIKGPRDFMEGSSSLLSTVSLPYQIWLPKAL